MIADHSSEPTIHEAAREAKQPIDALGAQRLFPTAELAEQFGDLSFTVPYAIGRPGPIARTPRVTTSLLGVVPLPEVEVAYAAVEDRSWDIDDFFTQYDAVCQRVGSRIFAGFHAAGELAEQLWFMLDGADYLARPVAAGWADLPRPDEDGARLERALSTLREYRFDGHRAVLATHGLLGVEGMLLTAIWREATDREATARMFGWLDGDLMLGIEALQTSGRIDEQEQLTERGRAEREAMERVTNALAADPWDAVEGDERRESLDLLAAAAAHAA